MTRLKDLESRKKTTVHGVFVSTWVGHASVPRTWYAQCHIRVCGHSQHPLQGISPDSKVHGANIGPILGRKTQMGPHELCYLVGYPLTILYWLGDYEGFIFFLDLKTNVSYRWKQAHAIKPNLSSLVPSAMPLVTTKLTSWRLSAFAFPNVLDVPQYRTEWHQASTWTNVDQVLWCHIDHSEFTSFMMPYRPQWVYKFYDAI